MGCTESVPIATEFDVPHKYNPTIPVLGSLHGAPINDNEMQQVMVKEKLFSWSGDTFKIQTPDMKSFGDNICIKGKAFAMRDRMVLLNGTTNVPIAVCLRKFELLAETFKIYTLTPNYDHQTPSQNQLEGKHLYTFGFVRRVPLSTVQEVYLERPEGPQRFLTIERIGFLWPKRRVVKKNNQPAALINGGTFDGFGNAYKITISPGIDPCLIVCICAICDEMDEDN